MFLLRLDIHLNLATSVPVLLQDEDLLPGLGEGGGGPKTPRAAANHDGVQVRWDLEINMNF